MNSLEWVFLLLFSVIHFVSLIFRKFTIRQALSITLASFPACWLVLDSMTQVLTCDDSYLIYEIVRMTSERLEYSWVYGAFHTSIALSGPILVVLKEATNFTQDILALSAKALQCFWGLALISIIADKAHRWYVPESSRVLFYITSFSAAALLPVVNLALHTTNYDLLSMCLGVLAILILGAGFSSGKIKYFVFSVMVSALAAQEKLIASPILWLSTIAFAMAYRHNSLLDWNCRTAETNKINTDKHHKDNYRQQGYLSFDLIRKKYSGYVSAALISTGCALTVFLSSHLVVIVFRQGNIPGDSIFGTILQPYLLAFWPFLRFFGVIFDLSSHSLLFEMGILVAAFVLIVFFVAVVLFFLSWLIGKKLFSKNRMVPIIRKARFWLLAGIVITGITATFFMNARVYPLVPVEEGFYKPTITFNGVSLSYGAKSLAGHVLSSTVWACATFVNAFPSVILFSVLLVWCIAAFSKEKPENLFKRTFVYLVAIAALVLILLFGALQMPLSPRYMNLFYYLFLIAGLIDIAYVKVRPGLKAILAVAGLVLIVIETLPFGPVPVTFRPFWSNMPEKFRDDPAYGQVPPWNTGWGEEVMLAGKKILNDHAQECSNGDCIRIYHNYSGSWLQRPPGVDLVFMHYGFDNYGYEDCDYYVFSRSGTTFSYIPFPTQVKPIFTISDRGVVKAWVFRASDIKAAGISFRKNYPE